MGFADRKTLSSVYMRYYFISPFNILSNLNRLNMNSMTKLPDCNINGAIISTSKEELKKENDNLSHTTYVRKKTREAKILKDARLRIGYSQQEVANVIGVHIKQYQRLEYGERDIRNCSMKTGLAVCAVLGIDPFDLVFGGEFESLGVFRLD